MSLLKKLGEKGKRTAVGLAMLGAVGAGGAGLSGCSTYWEATAPLWELHPEILQPGGYKDYKRKKKARQGQQFSRKYFALSFEKWVDINGDGKIEGKEFFGIKNEFKKDERIELFFYYGPANRPDEREITFKLYDPKGNLIDEGTNHLVKKEGVSNAYQITIDNRPERNLSQIGGLGEYTAVWYLNKNIFLKSHVFKIVE